MKTMKYLSMLLIMVAMSVCMTSCGDDDDDDVPNASASIVGKWTQTNDAGTVIILKFNSDKTGTINFTYSDGSGDKNENFEYDYIISNSGERILTIIGSSLAGAYKVTLSATKLQLRSDSSSYYYEFTKL